MEEKQINKKFDVLIVGGGFAGIYCARALQNKCRKKGLRVGLISAENYMAFFEACKEASKLVLPFHPTSQITGRTTKCEDPQLNC